MTLDFKKHSKTLRTASDPQLAHMNANSYPNRRFDLKMFKIQYLERQTKQEQKTFLATSRDLQEAVTTIFQSNFKELLFTKQCYHLEDVQQTAGIVPFMTSEIFFVHSLPNSDTQRESRQHNCTLQSSELHGHC